VVVDTLTDESDVMEAALPAVELAHGADDEDIPDVALRPERGDPRRPGGGRDDRRGRSDDRGRGPLPPGHAAVRRART
jgi:ATP-dependent RNA helicase DeaD